MGSGVPQGSVLGPILFVMYINDLPDMILSTAHMFSDDTKVYRNVLTESDHSMLPMIVTDHSMLPMIVLNRKCYLSSTVFPRG